MLPADHVSHPHVERRDGTGSPMVRGTPVPVRRLWSWHQRGVTIETLLKRYPTLKKSEVLCALAYAYDNQDVVEADLAIEQAAADAHDPCRCKPFTTGRPR